MSLRRLFIILIIANVAIPFFFLGIPLGLGPEGDALDYRMPLIDWALRHHEYPSFLWTYVDDFPSLAECVMALTRHFVTWGPRLVSVLGYTAYVGACARLASLILTPVWATAATLLLACANVATTQDNLVMVDTTAAAFSLLCLSFLLQPLLCNRPSFSAKSVFFAGIFAGLGLATRYTQIPILGAAFMTYAALRGLSLPSDQRKTILIKELSLGFSIALLIFSPWLIRNALLNHNPLYPLLTPILGGVHFTLQRHKEIFGMVANHSGFGTSALEFLLLPFRFAFFKSAYDYSVGPLLLMFLPWWIVCLWHIKTQTPKHVRSLLYCSSFFLVTLLSWFFTSQDGRFLIPIMPIGVIAGIKAMELFSKNQKLTATRQWSSLLLAILLVASTGGTYKHFKKHETDTILLNRSQVDVVDRINMLGLKTLLLNRTNNLHLITSDWMFAYPHVYSTSAYDYREYEDGSQYYAALYEEAGVRLIYHSATDPRSFLPDIRGSGYHLLLESAGRGGGYLVRLQPVNTLASSGAKR